MARMVFAKRMALARRGIIHAANSIHVRTRQPADGDAGAAGRMEQDCEEPEDQRGRGLLRAKVAKAKALATAKAAV